MGGSSPGKYLGIVNCPHSFILILQQWRKCITTTPAIVIAPADAIPPTPSVGRLRNGDGGSSRSICLMDFVMPIPHTHQPISQFSPNMCSIRPNMTLHFSLQSARTVLSTHPSHIFRISPHPHARCLRMHHNVVRIPSTPFAILNLYDDDHDRR
jgi:hypothetical protein